MRTKHLLHPFSAILIGMLFFAPMLRAQWAATEIAWSTYNSTLRPMSQGVYDPYADKSFFCFMQENSNPYVVECNHAGGLHTWGTPQKVLTQPSAEKYNYPTIDILPDRRLVLCCATPFDNALGFSISTNPADASSWTTKTVDIGSRHHVEYPRIKVDRRGHIYLFYIHQPDGKAAHKRWYHYVKSEDAGETWSAPVLAIQRELDDPNGMCELYVGYTASEPYRLGEPERWWFAFTSSSGFQYTGTHTGSNDSPVLNVTSPGWTSGDGFTYRWLYNITKGTNSGIASADLTSVTPSGAMEWDNGDQYGIAYHNIYHANVYVAYFRPDNGHWYDAAHHDLGTDISRAEMETPTARPYTTPLPFTTKDVGYVPMVTVNNQGYPTTEHNGTNYTWNGSQWITNTLTPNDDVRFFWFADDNYYLARARFGVYQSASMSTNWTLVNALTLPNSHSYAVYGVPVTEGHSMALFNVHEYKDNLAGTAWAVSQGDAQTAGALLLRTPNPVAPIGSTVAIRAFVAEKRNGARSRIRNANNAITLSVVSGNAQIAALTRNAANGLAEFSLTHTGSGEETIVVKASSPGLTDYYMNITVDANALPITAIVPQTPGTNASFELIPNPACQSSAFVFSLPEASVAELKIFNLAGQELGTLHSGNLPTGSHQIGLSANPLLLGKGMYVAQLRVGEKVQSILFECK